MVPTSLEALQEAVAASSGRLRVAGAGTKTRGPADATPRLELHALSGIVGYNPAECVITVLAGTPVAAIENALASHGQYLAFDPTHVRAGGTIGGTVASGLSGSGRYRYGGVRDFIIGARVVDGRGRLIASGGQVVKNAAGFLTHHALVGSAGRLGAIGEVTFKVFPRPEARATIRVRCASLSDAYAVHERVRAAAMDLDALDLELGPGGAAVVWARLGGAADALPARLTRARAVAACASDVLTAADDARIWGDAAELAWAAEAATLVKVPATPSRVLAVATALGSFGRCRVQCGGAIVLLATDQALDTVHAALADRGWRGVVVQGPAHGRLLGATAGDAFVERVRLALDPDRRFH